MTKVYPVILSSTKSGFVVSVPDLDIDTQGSTLAEAIYMARDAIGLWGISEQDNGRPVPEPSTAEPSHEANEFVSWVDIDFDRYRKLNDMETVRMNITLPKGLKLKGEEAKVNFSGLLQDALKTYLNSDRPQL